MDLRLFVGEVRMASFLIIILKKSYENPLRNYGSDKFSPSKIAVENQYRNAISRHGDVIVGVLVLVLV